MHLTHISTLWAASITASIPHVIANSVPRDDFMELLSPSRLAPLLKQMGFRSEASVGILTGYDLQNKRIERWST